MDVGNMHNQFGKDCTWGSGDILSNRTDTERDLSEYFATAPTGKVKINCCN